MSGTVQRRQRPTVSATKLAVRVAANRANRIMGILDLWVGT
jgi:hypothetical protein